jgi:CRP/FNR family transcriptional regulator, polysaccharide utilization system transcription regulator
MTKSRMTAPDCLLCNYKNNPLFCVLQTDEVKAISDSITFSYFIKGQIIFHEGNHPQCLYCVHTGKVKIHKLGEEGKEQIVRFATQSNLLGYRALLSGECYTASATALEDTKLCLISKQVFMELIHNNPVFSLQTIKLLSKDLKTAEDKIVNMAQKPVRERIAESLLMLKELYGVEIDSGFIKSVLSRRDISNIAGTTTETTIRVLADLKHINAIDLIGKKIKIENLPKLIEIANIID